MTILDKEEANRKWEAMKKHIKDNYKMSDEKAVREHFRPSGDRGFHSSDAHRAAEELRMEGKGSHDPSYSDSKKNK